MFAVLIIIAGVRRGSERVSLSPQLRRGTAIPMANTHTRTATLPAVVPRGEPLLQEGAHRCRGLQD